MYNKFGAEIVEDYDTYEKLSKDIILKYLKLYKLT